MQFLWNSPHAKMETVYKKYNCLDLQDWWVDAGAIQGGSFCKAKESILSMDSLLRIQIEKKNMPAIQDMKDGIANLRLHINSDNLEKLLELNSFKD